MKYTKATLSTRDELDWHINGCDFLMNDYGVCDCKKKLRTKLEEAYQAGNVPMGVSNWMNHGKQYGYDTFFLDKQKQEIKEKIIEKSTFEGGVSSNGWYQIYKDDLDLIM